MLFKSNLVVSSIFGIIVVGSVIYGWYAGLGYQESLMVMFAVNMFTLMIWAMVSQASSKIAESEACLAASYIGAALFMATIAMMGFPHNLPGTIVFGLASIGIAAVTATFVEEPQESLLVRTVQAFPIIGVLFELIRRRGSRLAAI